MGVHPPCTLIIASSGVHVLGPLAGPPPQGSFEQEEDATKDPSAVPASRAAVGLVPCRRPPARSHVWPPEPERAAGDLGLATSEPPNLGQVL